MKVTVSLTKREAEAILRSDHIEAGWHARPSKALLSADEKIKDAVAGEWNRAIDEAPDA